MVETAATQKGLKIYYYMDYFKMAMFFVQQELNNFFTQK